VGIWTTFAVTTETVRHGPNSQFSLHPAGATDNAELSLAGAEFNQITALPSHLVIWVQYNSQVVLHVDQGVWKMSGEHPELDSLQAAYRNAVEAWSASIRREEQLPSAADH
jgi:hypothetical protein